MSTFRSRLGVATALIAILLSWFAIATFLGETLAPKSTRRSQDLTSRTDGLAAGTWTEWSARIAPLRGDLLSAVAFARGGRLASGRTTSSPELSAEREDAISLAKESLSLAPWSSSTWLLLANLQNLASNRSAAAEALRMSYLTSSSDFDLIPERLGVFATTATPDLNDLARGDIRIILTQRPDLKAAISDAYSKASGAGRPLFFELVNSQDPAFAASLR